MLGNYGFILTKAIETVKDIATAVKQWKKVAADFGLSKREIDRMTSAFEHEDLDKAEKFLSTLF